MEYRFNPVTGDPLPEGYIHDPNHIFQEDGSIIAAGGALTAAHSAWDPGLGPCIEAALVAATKACLAEGHSVYEGEIIQARKQAYLEHVLDLRAEGVSVDEIMHLIEVGDGPPQARS